VSAWLVDVAYLAAKSVRVVQDNLYTQTAGALYEIFAPAVARRICAHLELHYTAKHGS
jgi:hypothetical protein